MSAIALHELKGSAYERIPASRLIPMLDFELLTRFVTRTDQPQALREYRDLIRG